jgi:hypothetical protein
MRALALFCLVPLLLSAQVAGVVRAGRGNPGPAVNGTVPPAPPPTPAEDLCTMEGQVFNAVTGQALRKANISMNMTSVTSSTPPGRRSFSGSTDASGRFSISGIEPGTYRVSADHTGFLSMQYNARRPSGPGTSLDLARAQKMTGVVFRLTPHGVLTGKVVDEDGDPLEGVQMQLMRLTYNQGRKQLQVNDNGNTNDLGEFRMAGVVPGKYYLCATYRGRGRMIQVFQDGMTVGVQGDPQAAQQEQQDYVPTYYPGATDIAAATPIEMKAGQQIQSLDFRLTKVHTVHVRGRVTNNTTAAPPPPPPPTDEAAARAAKSAQEAVQAAQMALQNAVSNLTISLGSAAANVSVHLQPRNALNPQGLNVNGRVRPDGTFDFPSVAPGAYTLVAVTNQGNRSHFARLPVDVGNANVDGLSIAINPGIAVIGRVRLDGDTTDNPPSFNIRLTPRDPGPGINMGQPAKAGADGNFRIDDVNADRYNITINPTPGNLYVKSIRAGNIDVMASGFDLSNGSAAPLDIVIGTTPSQIAGAVQNESTQQPAVAVTVVMIPQEKERREQSTYYRTVTTDQYGKFSMTKLVPGEYKAYAFEEVESGAWYDPDFMKLIEGKGESISVREGMPATLSLTMIPAGR